MLDSSQTQHNLFMLSFAYEHEREKMTDLYKDIPQTSGQKKHLGGIYVL
jgi:hypothetical protein